MNLWNIPKLLEEEIRARDKACVYCGVSMTKSASRGESRKAAATWEHILTYVKVIEIQKVA